MTDSALHRRPARDPRAVRVPARPALDGRSIALSIPISVLATFIVMYRFGLSLNLMSLGGLALGDRHRWSTTRSWCSRASSAREEAGDGPFEAASEGHGHGRDGGDRLHAHHRRRVLPAGLRAGPRRPAHPRPGADHLVLAARLARRRAHDRADARRARRAGDAPAPATPRGGRAPSRRARCDRALGRVRAAVPAAARRRAARAGSAASSRPSSTALLRPVRRGVRRARATPTRAVARWALAHPAQRARAGRGGAFAARSSSRPAPAASTCSRRRSQGEFTLRRAPARGHRAPRHRRRARRRSRRRVAGRPAREVRLHERRPDATSPRSRARRSRPNRGQITVRAEAARPTAGPRSASPTELREALGADARASPTSSSARRCSSSRPRSRSRSTPTTSTRCAPPAAQVARAARARARARPTSRPRSARRPRGADRLRPRPPRRA